MRSRLSDPHTWLERYGDVLYRYALIRLNEPTAAEDAVQETFLAALEARKRYTGNASERTWLIGILKHKIVDQLRKGRRESSDDQATEADTGYPTNQLFDERGRWKAEVSSWSDPDRALEQAQFWGIFEDCIAALPPRLARTFILKEVDGLTGEEICKVLGLSTTNNLWVMLSRARLRLRQCLELNWFEKAPGGGR